MQDILNYELRMTNDELRRSAIGRIRNSSFVIRNLVELSSVFGNCFNHLIFTDPFQFCNGSDGNSRVSWFVALLWDRA